jgi:hypothetical protein
MLKPREEEIADSPRQNTAGEKKGEKLPLVRAALADGYANLAVIHESVFEFDHVNPVVGGTQERYHFILLVDLSCCVELVGPVHEL